jgi:hypothetical protein
VTPPSPVDVKFRCAPVPQCVYQLPTRGGVADGTGSRSLKFDLAATRSTILRNRSQLIAAMRKAGASEEQLELQRARFRRHDAMARNRAFDRQLSELS